MERNKVLELAIEAMVSVRGHYDETGSTPQELERFAALIEREVLGDAEPVAWLIKQEIPTEDCLVRHSRVSAIVGDYNRAEAHCDIGKPIPLYTHPTPTVVRQLEEIKKVNEDLEDENERLRSANKNLQDSFDQIYQDCQNLVRALKEITKAIDATPVKTYQKMESIAHKALASAKEAGL